jgi:hypothetical protein
MFLVSLRFDDTYLGMYGGAGTAGVLLVVL